MMPRELQAVRPVCFAVVAVLTLMLLGAADTVATENGTRLAGHWEGKIELPGAPLHFDVDFAADGGELSGDISIPAQNASDLPLVGVSFDGDAVRFEIDGVPGSPTFEGELREERILGDFSQGGGAFRFEMWQGESLAARARAALEGLDEPIESALEELGVPGLAVAVVADDEIVYERGFGKRNRESGLDVTENTLFAIGSTSKAFTAFVLGTLVDAGELEWDEPVIEYLPDFRLADDHATRRLKVRDLLIHSSGLPRHDLVWYNSTASREELVHRLRYLEPTRDLGEEFQYQNLMFLTAGYLAERMTGRSWEELVRERIFEPLGMARSNFSVEQSQRDADHALPYLIEDREARPIPFRNIDTVGPAGSINSSVHEMTSWLRLQLGGGKLGETRLIEEGTLREMHTPHMALATYPSDPDTIRVGYGLGWAIESHRGHYLVQHGGGIDGFISWVALLPFDRLGVVVYTNASGPNPLPTVVGKTAIDRVLGLDEIDYLTQAKEALAKAEESRAEAEDGKSERRVENTSLSHELEAYVGAYGHPGYGTVDVTLAEGLLRLEYHRIPAALEHWHYDTFVARTGEGDPTFRDMKFQFRSDSEGRVVELLAPFEPAVEPIVFERQPDRRLAEASYLERFEGAYELAGQRATVERRGDTLRVSLPGQPVYTLEPTVENEFRLSELEGFSVEFVVDDGGAVAAVLFHQPNGTFEAKRVADAAR